MPQKANVKLYLFQLGMLQPLGVPIPGYLIQTIDKHNVMVDSGLPYEFIKNPPGPMGPAQLQVEVHEEDHIVNRLATIGLHPDDIDFLIVTHFDADHAGNLSLFTKAELVVQLEHYEVSLAGYPRSQRAREHWDRPDLHYRQVEGDITLLPGIELIKTSGHVPGHQSVLVRLPNSGPVLLAIDAVPTAAMMDAETRTIMSNDDDESQTRASTRKLAEIAEREGVKLIIHGHDADQWPTLKHSPQFYD
ncbi:N-acyl homoserine lactonase AiiA [Abditibacteriota bacterium]|nr:N-acyl homoserine lactonase AiiA [Abditibacteriota bacterium]